MPTLSEMVALRGPKRPRHLTRAARRAAAPKQPRAVELGMLKGILAINRKARKLVIEALRPVLGEIAKKDVERKDIAEGGPFNRLQMLAGDLIRLYGDDEVDPITDRAAIALNRFNVREWRNVLAVRLGDSPATAALLDRFRRESADRIQSLPDEIVSRVRDALVEAQQDGLRVEEIEGRLAYQFDIVDSKAAFIARDQVLKTNGALTQQRQTDAGVQEYVWTSSHDERVRPMHAKLDGTRHHWSFPPVVSEDGRREHPGQDYQCRCTATPILPSMGGGRDEEDTQ